MKTKDSHSMQLHFKVESPANFVKMCCTIHFEKKEELSDYITVWHDAFDGASGDQLFEQFLEELFPGGLCYRRKGTEPDNRQGSSIFENRPKLS